MMNGLFIVFEGIDGSGKSCLIEAIAKKLGDKCVITNEPSGCALGKEIDKLLANDKLVTSRYTELFLYEAARVEHIHKVILPALNVGKIILCDRFTDSSLVYQSEDGVLNENIIRQLNDIASPLKPNLTIWINTDVEVAMARSKKSDHRDFKPKEFYENLQKKYAQLYRKKQNCFEIKSSGKFNDIFQQAIDIIDKYTN